MSANNKPVVQVTLHPVSGAIWRNTNAKGEAFFTATFDKAYKDETGAWKSTNSFSPDQVLLLAKVADLVHTEMSNLRSPANSAIIRYDDQSN